MRYWFFNMIPKRNVYQWVGKLQLDRGSKKLRKKDKSKLKAMLIVFFGINRIITIERTTQGQMVNEKYDIQLLIKLRDKDKARLAWKTMRGYWIETVCHNVLIGQFTYSRSINVSLNARASAIFIRSSPLRPDFKTEKCSEMNSYSNRSLQMTTRAADKQYKGPPWRLITLNNGRRAYNDG